MAKFQISWTEEVWQRVIIEAESEDQANELFYMGEFDPESVKITGGEVQDGVDIEEMELV